MGVDIIIPQAGESVAEGTIVAWRKKDGEYVARDEDVLELETDKVTLAVPAPASGILTRAAKEGDIVKVGGVVGRIEPSAAPAKSDAPPTTPAPAPANGHAEVRATPLARKTAEQLKVDIGTLHGTGPGGRVREQDVVGAARGSVEAPKTAPTPAAPGGSTRERMSPIRQRIAQRLVQAQHTAAMLTTFNECDMSAVMDLRKRYKEEFEKKHGVGLGFMGFFVRAAVQALRAFPLVNASIVEEGGALFIEKHDSCDIAIAVASPKGLVVPVVRRCESLSLAGIESGIKELAGRARDGKITIEEMQDGTFTITNGGIFGSLMSTPILNPPQSAILGMHAIKNRAVEDPRQPGQVAIRPMMYLALSYDHRIIDGSEAVQFLVKIKTAIEDPSRLLLEC